MKLKNNHDVSFVMEEYVACRFHRLGLYGHSAVYHEKSDTIYVFGGFEYLTDKTIASGNLYALDLRRPAWSLLSPEENNKVFSVTKYFFTLILTRMFGWCRDIKQILRYSCFFVERMN